MRFKSLIAAAAVALAASCAKEQPLPFHVVPMPNDVTFADGSFSIAGAPLLIDGDLDEMSVKAVRRFVTMLETASGKACREGEGGMHFMLNPNLAAEQYAINVDEGGVVVEASALNGFVYACETLKQMLPPQIYSPVKVKAAWVLPCVSILDQPRFDYRGMHMDPCRHFWELDEVYRYIDIMASFKMNRLHWHLTDDQGWRIEIKRYPRLTEVGAWRDGTVIGKDWDSSDGIRHGGFYTQDELRAVVEYAAERGITVIPEIDLPGHMLAALAAYPELGCTGGPYAVWQRWGVSPDILCAGNEEVFTFLEGVLTEVMDIFPSEFIHVGGDECFARDAANPWDSCPKCAARMRRLGIRKGPMAKHYLQNYVTERVQRFLGEHGRRIIGWDEILEGNLAPGATIMSWRGLEGGIMASAKGFDAIMTPNGYLYLDYYQGDERDKEPFGIGGRLPLEKVYSYEPFDGIVPGAEDHIIGVQANLWTEYIATPEHLEYMLLPRMCAVSEIQWCDASLKDWDRFNASLDSVFEMLDARGYNYSLDCRGLVGLDRIPARDSTEMAEYMATKTWTW